MSVTINNPDDTFQRPSGAPLSQVTLEARFDYAAGERLKVHLRVRNQSDADIYLLNRLWSPGKDSYPAPDPQLVYRFVRDGRLSLLLGAAPLPRMKTVAYRNIPFATKVRAKEAYEDVLQIPAPVKEYSLYFGEHSRSVYKTVKANSVELSVQIVEARPTFQTEEVAFNPAAVEIITPGVLDFVQVLRAGPVAMEVEVLRRMDEFERPSPADRLP